MPELVKGVNKDISAKRLGNAHIQEDMEKIIKLIGNKIIVEIAYHRR